MKRIFLASSFILAGMFASGQLQPSFNDDGTCGYKDAKTGKVIKGDYNHCGEFIGNEALVQKDGKYMLINTEGAHQEWYTYKFVNHKKNGELMFLTDSTTGTINTVTGKVTHQEKFKQLYFGANSGDDIYVMTRDSLIGLYSKREGLLLPVEYQTDDFMSTFMMDGDLYFSSDAVFPLKHKGKWGLTDIYGKTLAPFEYDYITVMYFEDKLAPVLKNSKWGLINHQGKVVLPMAYDHFFGRQRWGDNKSHYPYVFLNEGKITFYDESFKKIVASVSPGKYYWDRVDHTFLLYKNKFGLIDNKGTIVIPFEYDEITRPSIEDSVRKIPIYQVRKGTKWALFKPYKGVVTDFVECTSLASIYWRGKTLCYMNKGGKITLYDLNLKPLSTTEFDKLEQHENVIYVSSGNKRGILSMDGSVKWE